ncbi:MAG TPA: hypothetical protein VKP58_05760 [Candidatus Acidoferrum sp.]|nr:hypothetical protein [Candidatus Acidoferrum sp.]
MSSITLAAEQKSQLQDLASRVLKHGDAARSKEGKLRDSGGQFHECFRGDVHARSTTGGQRVERTELATERDADLRDLAKFFSRSLSSCRNCELESKSSNLPQRIVF